MIIVDIDECSEGSHTCGANRICTNTNGSFKCDCEIGFYENTKTCTCTGINHTIINIMCK
jgi:hypothetical protein